MLAALRLVVSPGGAAGPYSRASMRSFLPVLVLGVITLVFVGASLLPWLRLADPEWIANGDAEAANVVGAVRDAKGQPVPGVEVVWYSEATDVGSGGMTAFSGGVRATTGADGTYRFASLPTTNGFVALDEAKSKWEGRTGEFEPRKGFDARIDVAAVPVASARSVRGRLLLADGKPAALWMVTARVSTWFTAWQGGGTTSADGAFEIVLPWDEDDAELTWVPLDGSLPVSEPVHVRPGEAVEVRVGAGK